MTDPLNKMPELWICERKTHLPEHDGATGYFYYEPRCRYEADLSPTKADTGELGRVREALETAYSMSKYAAATRSKNTQEFLHGDGYETDGLYNRISEAQLKLEQALRLLSGETKEWEK